MLVQLSDDWIPCHGYDLLIWAALEEAAKKRGGTIATDDVVLSSVLIPAEHEPTNVVVANGTTAPGIPTARLSHQLLASPVFGMAPVVRLHFDAKNLIFLHWQ